MYLTYNDNVFTDVDVWIDDSSVDDGTFTDENVIANLKGEKRDTVKNFKFNFKFPRQMWH